MSFVIGFVGLIIVLIGSGLRYHQRRIRVFAVQMRQGIQDSYDFGECDSDWYKQQTEEYEAEIKKHDSRIQKLKYGIGIWSLYLLGGVFLTAAAFVYFQEDPKRTWEDLGKLVFIVVLIGSINLYVSETNEKFQEMNYQIDRLKERLKGVVATHDGRLRYLLKKIRELEERP